MSEARNGQTADTFDKNTPRGLLDGPLGGLLGGLSGEGEFRPSWGPLGASLDLLTLEASFCCTKHNIFDKLGVLRTSRGQGDYFCQMSLAFYSFLKRARRASKEEKRA